MDLPIKEGLFHTPESKNDKPYLIGAKCSLCGYVCFPKKDVCVRCCKNGTMETAKFGPYAKLDSFAVMQVAPPGFVAPYIQGYVVLDDGPKIFTLISGCEPEDNVLQLGEKMELVIEKITVDDKGNNLIGWIFRPFHKREKL